MQDDDLTNRPNRKLFRFGLRTLFVLTLVCCFIALTVKWRNDAIIAKKKNWLLNHGGSNGVLLEDGDVVLIRNEEACGAIVVKSQNITPERMEYDWYYRTDGSGMVFADDTAVTNGSSTSGEPTSEMNMHIGPFDLQWSGGDRGFGWFYYPDDPAVEFHVMRKQRLQNIDVMSDRWEFTSISDKPPETQPPWAELADQVAK